MSSKKHNRINIFWKYLQLKFSTDNTTGWLLLSLVIKGLFFIYLISYRHPPSDVEGFLGVIGGDARSYIEPIDNLISKNSYYPDHRMPGLGALYYLIRLLFEKALALNVLIFLQYVFSAVSVYFLASLALKIFKKSIYFYATFFVYLFSTFISLWDVYVLTESLAASSFILTIYLFYVGVLEQKKKKLFLSGLFYAWLVFLKPVFAPLIILFILAIIINGIGKRKLIVISIIVFAASLFTLDGIWTARNYSKHKKIIVLQAEIYYDGTKDFFGMNLFEYLQSWGGDVHWWDPNAEVRLFNYYPSNEKERKKLEQKKVTFPDRAFTSAINKDSLDQIRTEIAIYFSDTSSQETKTLYNENLSAKLNRFTESMKDEKPFLNYIGSRVIYFKKFVLHSGTYNLLGKSFNQLNYFEIIIKLIMSALYLFIMVIGLLGVGINVILLVYKKQYFWLLFPLITIYSIGIFPLVKLVEYRYLTNSYPFLLIYSIYFCVFIYDWQIKKRIPKKRGSLLENE